MSTLIRAQVSERILSKVDRLFTNRLDHIFVELLQNARRAGATLVSVTAEDLSDNRVRIILADNGSGIDDFAKLLHLGDSGWNDAIEQAEDPAGMGFFSLIHDGVTVESGTSRAVITMDQFLGKEPVTVEDALSPAVQGTRLTFIHGGTLQAAQHAVKSVARFGPIDVLFNGEPVERADFLADAVKVKEFNGVRIGVFGYTDHGHLVNFLGNVILFSDKRMQLRHGPVKESERGFVFSPLSVKFDIIDTATLHLKLPDRKDVVCDQRYENLMLEARRAMFEYVAEQPHHNLTFSEYQEALSLGISLKESSACLEPFFVSNLDAPSSPFDSDMIDAKQRFVDRGACALVEASLVAGAMDMFTFKLAFRYFEKLELAPFSKNDEMQGFAWYDSLPVYRNFKLTIDGVEHFEYAPQSLLTAVDSIVLSFDLAASSAAEAPVLKSFSWTLPVACWNTDDSEYFCNDPRVCVSKNSAWVAAQDPSVQPFDLVDAAAHVAFQPSDDFASDSYETQIRDFRLTTERVFRESLCGPLGTAQLLLNRALNDWDLRCALNKAKVQEVRLLPTGDNNWRYELVA